jgi:hypothetical protein
MTRLAVAVAAALLAAAAPAAAAPASPGLAQITVSVDRTRITTRLGRSFVFHSTIANDADAPATGLIAHLNVLSLRPGVYVDPEDWSSHRTRYLAPIPSHGSSTVTWRVKAVNAGSIGVYVAVLPGAGPPVRPVAGPLLQISIADRKSLNSGGIAPLALGVPALLAVLFVVVRLRRRAG